jgi:oligopeptide/dipeptide ABC transporter ATP-binding protein
MYTPLLTVKGLKSYSYDEKYKRFLRIVDDVSFDIQKGECVGILGESGSGKSRTVHSILGLVPNNPGVIAGEVWFSSRKIQITSASHSCSFNLLEGIQQCCTCEDLGCGGIKVKKKISKWNKVEKQIRRLCGKEIALIPQEVKSALNPFHCLKTQIAESYWRGGGDKEKTEEAIGQILNRLSLGEKEAAGYPHIFSAGIATRAAIAIAIASNPSLLIADEPTTGLDVPLQFQIIQLLKDFTKGCLPFVGEAKERALLVITHDMALLEKLVDRIVVMYNGRIVEIGGREIISDLQAKHPYTKWLIKLFFLQSHGGLLPYIPGKAPNLLKPPKGCKFHPRCQGDFEVSTTEDVSGNGRMDICSNIEPELQLIDSASLHSVRCHLYNRKYCPPQ